ncbi:MAG TPA: nuclear transport factor 2 family protein [Kofleriaceae bacterium]|jgi:ketosteroid isomerase-like protein|nr:nuclear transport factor 2 family protein [Kofleriaceae bacterium]
MTAMAITKPEDFYPALVDAYQSRSVDAMVALYDPKAVFVIKPGRVTDGPAELRTALQRMIDLRGRINIQPRSFIRSDNTILVLGSFTLTGHKRDGSPVELGGRFADVLRQQPDGSWQLAVDNGFADE